MVFGPKSLNSLNILVLRFPGNYGVAIWGRKDFRALSQGLKLLSVGVWTMRVQRVEGSGLTVFEEIRMSWFRACGV